MKKKITMLFAALLACAGVAKAQEVYVTDLKDLSNDKVYFLESARCFLLNSANVNGLATSNGNDVTAEEKTKDWSNVNQQFKIEKDGDNYYLYSVGAGKYVSKADGAWSDTKTDALTLENVGGNYPWKLCVGGNGLNSQIAGQVSSGMMVNWWTSADEGNCYKILDVEASIVYDITYLFKYAGETIGTQTATVGKGEEYPSVDVTKFPYGFTATAPTGSVTANEELEIELTPAFPWADSYENITAWYYLDLKDGKYLYYEEGQTSIPLTKTAVDSNNKDAYTWGFIGDPINGFQIVNRAAGSSMILSSTTNTFDGNKGGSTYPVMVTVPVPDGNNTYWIFTASGYRENGFFIGQKDANNGKNRLNNRGDKLAYWNEGADGGSTFVMVERPMGAVAELAALLEEIEAMGIVGGENIGDYTVASVTALNEAVAAAKAVETATAEDVATLQAAFEGLRIVLPDANKFYAFNCVYDNRKLYINANNQLTYAQNYDLTNSRAVFQFEEGSQPNTVKIKSVHNQSYMGAISGNPITFGATGADITIARSVSNELTYEQKPLAVMFTTDGTNGLHANGGNVQAYTNIAISNHYILSEVTEFKHALTIDEYDYMTLTLGFNAEVPEGVTAYKVTGTEGKELTLESVGTVIPAGEPVIVYAEVAEEKMTAEFAYTAEEATKSGDNLLKGTLVDNSAVAPTTGYDAYVMALNGTEVVMGKATLNEGVFKNRANKAYLELPTVQDAPAMFSFGRGEGTTGIETAVNGEQTAVIYDLAGRRVEKMEKGIYIVNGKKVIK